MARHKRKHKCKHCKVFFDSDARNVGRQSYCSKPPCRKVSKAANQRRWLGKPQNRNYFRSPVHTERVRQWRKEHPGYWRRKTTFDQDALQDTITPRPIEKQQLESGLTQHALQGSLFVHPAVFVGLIAHLSGLSLQDDIEQTARRLPVLIPWANCVQAELLLDLFCQVVAQGLIADRVVHLGDFGKFVLREVSVPSPAHNVQFPRGQRASERLKRGDVDPAALAGRGRARRKRRIPKFKPGYGLRAAVNGGIDTNRG